MDEIMKQVAANGIGGILAIAMFMLYRRDIAEQSKRVDAFASDYRQVVTENTKAITVLVQYIESFDRTERDK